MKSVCISAGEFRARGSSPARAKRVVANVELGPAGVPKEVQVKFRLPAESPLKTATVNGRAATFSGLHGDCVTIETGKERNFEIVANFA